MDEFTKKIAELGRQAQNLGRLKLELLREEIDAALGNDEAPLLQLEHLLDELYDPIMWGYGEEQYRQLLQKLTKTNSKAADFYRKELKELLNDNS